MLESLSHRFKTGDRTFQLLKLTVESTGSWRCTNTPCSLAVQRDTQKELLDRILENDAACQAAP